jgi:hypothetical protein
MKRATNTTIESSDPVFAQDGEWYFYDEVWANRKGPYRTEQLARAGLLLYCEYEVEGRSPLPFWD